MTHKRNQNPQDVFNKKTNNKYKGGKQMKKSTIVLLLAAACLIMSSPAGAARSLDLSGNSYNIFILCADDVGDYCTSGKLINDTFNFDGNNFEINSFEENLGGLLGDGQYSASGFSFNAQYEAIEGTATYDFEITGLNLVDIILFGTIDITFTKYVNLDKDTEEGKALFIGIKN
jgi:hypothetical protein